MSLTSSLVALSASQPKNAVPVGLGGGGGCSRQEPPGDAVIGEYGSLRYPIPLRRIIEYRDILENITLYPDKYTKYELAEAYERFAIALFFYGNLNEAESMLVQTLKARKDLPVTLSNCRCSLLLGNIAYRLGDMPQAEAHFDNVITASKKVGNKAFEAVGRSNIAVAKYNQNKLYEGIEFAKAGIDASGRVNSKDSEEHYSHIRIFLVGILKTSDFRKFETVLNDYPLPKLETALLMSTSKYMQGKFNDAKQVISETLAEAEEYLSEIAKLSPAPDPDPNPEKEVAEADAKVAEAEVAALSAGLEEARGGIGPEQATEKKIGSKSQEMPNKSQEMPQRLPRIGVKIESKLIVCAQTKLNMSLLLSKFPSNPSVVVESASASEAYIDRTINIVESYINTYKSIQIEQLKKSNPFNKGSLSENPIIESFDHVTLLMVVVSQLLLDQAANIVKNYRPTKAFSIAQSKNVGLSSDDNYGKDRHIAILSRISALFSIDKLKEFRLNEMGVNFLNEQGKLIPSYEQPEKKFEDISAETLSSLKLYDSIAIMDLLQISSMFWSFLEDKRDQITSFSNSTSNLLKTRHSVLINPKTGVKDKTSSVIPYYAADNDAKEKKKKDDEKLPRKKAVSAASYSSNVHDIFTNRAALMPFSSPMGFTDVSILISWVMAATGIPGLGMMMMNSKKITPFDPEMIPNPNVAESKVMMYAGASPEPSESLLKEARARMIEIETEFESRYKTPDSCLPGDKELRLLLNVCIAKISVQLNIRPNLQTYVSTIEMLSTDLVKDKDFCEPNLIALSKRCRLDYEEWLSASAASKVSNDKKLNRMCTEFIPLIKDYIQYAKMGGDLELIKDSMRRYMNMYIEISKVPQNPGDPPLEHATLEKLESLFLPKDVDKKEGSDCNWMRQYGRARAHQILVREFKNLS